MIGCIQLCIYTYIHSALSVSWYCRSSGGHGPWPEKQNLNRMYRTLHKVWQSSTVVTMVTAFNFYTLFDLPTEILFFLILNLLSAYIVLLNYIMCVCVWLNCIGCISFAIPRARLRMRGWGSFMWSSPESSSSRQWTAAGRLVREAQRKRTIVRGIVWNVCST